MSGSVTGVEKETIRQPLEEAGRATLELGGSPGPSRSSGTDKEK